MTGFFCRRALFVVAWLAAVVSAGSLDLRADEIDFVRDVQPLLRRHCYECHGHDVQEGGLRLDQKKQALAGGDSGRVIIPQKSAESRLVQLISGRDPDGLVMPPKDETLPLSAKQVKLLAAWVDAGAVWPDGVDPVVNPAGELWSFKPVKRPPIPEVKQKDWVENPIDAFILARLEAAGLKPSPVISPRVLIRRMTLDLHGLPPEPEDVDAFEAASLRTPDSALDTLIDRLLASPHYGERWGRHWLDLVRYADTNGYEIDGEKPLAWQFRDYVIRSLNEDRPYNRFIMEQLAGDELDDASSETVIATGFIRLGPWDAERGASVQPAEVIEERYNELDDMVSTTSQVFLGLTLGCARCHDHKFDPLTARDYYSMVATFNPLSRPRTGRNEEHRSAVPPRDLGEKKSADAKIAELRKRIRSLQEPLRRGLLETKQTGLVPDAIAATLLPPEKRNDAQKQLVERYRLSLDKEVARAFETSEIVGKFLSQDDIDQVRAAQKEVAELEAQFTYPAGYFLVELDRVPRPTHLLRRGNPKQIVEVVQPTVPAAVVEQAGLEMPHFESPDGFTSRRRISLARWIADPDNPLTARVIVNRVWQYHFGLGLVRTPSDFGKRGTPPTHPELLDWLADWFVHDADWSLKKLHRLILTSNTWRQSTGMRNSEFGVRNDSPSGPQTQGTPHSAFPTPHSPDPDNRLFGRFPYRRLQVEAIRDSILAVSGRLNGQLYGAGMYPQIPDDARRSGYNPKGVWKDFNEVDASRRTIYAYVKRTFVVPLFDTLDFCNTNRSTDRRDSTIVAPQALELLNGEFINRQVRHVADRLIAECGDDVNRQITRGFRLAIGRSPHAEELAAFRDFLDHEQVELIRTRKLSVEEARRLALAEACRVILNLNEFVYPD